MARITKSVSAMWSLVKCPKCGELVDPSALIYEEPTPPAGESDGKRWSFVWTTPRGDFCPKCEFPLSKYFGRLRWIRALMVGVAIVVVAFASQMLGHLFRLGDVYYQITKYAIRLGALVALVGTLGVVIGGKRGVVRAVDPM